MAGLSLIHSALPQRFWDKVNFDGPEVRPGLGPCWLWTSATRQGYGCIRINGRTESAHRLVLEAKLGRPIQRELNSLHSCDVRLCVNPLHLSEGTRSVNMYEAHQRGRFDGIVYARGERHGSCRLTEVQVREILASGEKQQVLADRYGVSHQLIWRIRKREIWKHLDG